MPRRAQSGKHSVYHELLDACAKGGCPACTLTLAAVTHYLESIIYEHVNDPEFRDAVVASRGYCNSHSWRLREMRVALGVALIYRDVVRDAAEEIARRAGSGDGRPDVFGSASGRRQGRGVRDWLAARAGVRPGDAHGEPRDDPHRACPACKERDRSEGLYLGALLDNVGDERVAQGLRDAGGLCLVHLDRLVATARDAAALDTLLALQRECLLRLNAELDEFIRKNDYRFAHEGMGAEANSWVRALETVAGKPGIR